jgi:hypothetical protein
MSVALYVLFIAFIALHAPTEPAYDFEWALRKDVGEAGGGFGPTTGGEWFDWLNGALLPAVLPQEDYNQQPLPLERRGRIAQYGLVVAGIRLMQTRSAALSCGDSVIATLYNDTCYPMDTTSVSPFGNLSLADEAGVGSAFRPSSVHGQDPDGFGGSVFQLFLNVEDDADTVAAYTTALQEARWLDEATKMVKVQLAVLNAQVGLFARVEFTATFTRGGRVDALTFVTSMPIEPYAGPGGGALYLLDVVMLGYVAYLLVGAVRRWVRAVRSHGSGWERFTKVFGFWRVLDFGAVASLLACIVTWYMYVEQVTAIRSDIAAAHATPATYAGGPPSLHVSLYLAMNLMDNFKMAAVWALIFLSARLFKYFTFQPRLAVMTDTLARAWDDGLHFAFLFAILLTMYGVWGYFMFGPQAPDWHSLNTSTVSVIRFMMYDYDLPAMSVTYPTMANFYCLSFMVLITNMTLWMFLAIILESYTEVRSESQGAPSVMQEAVAFAQSVPMMDWSPPDACANILPRSAGGAKKRKEATWNDVITALETGPLRFSADVTVAQLHDALHLRTGAAARLVAEARQAAATAEAQAAAAAKPVRPPPFPKRVSSMRRLANAYYGSEMPGAAPLPRTLERELNRVERSISMHRASFGRGADVGNVFDDEHERASLHGDGDRDGNGSEGGPAPAGGADLDDLTDRVAHVALQLARLKQSRGSTPREGGAGGEAAAVAGGGLHGGAAELQRDDARRGLLASHDEHDSE